MSGFYQIEPDEIFRDITSFSTSNGSYRFTRLPFGLKLAPNSFQRMMTIAFSGLEPSHAFLYMCWGRGGLIGENRWSPKIEWYAKNTGV